MIEGHVIVIGAMKAGTTTLHDLLAGHPDLVTGRRKELNFFSNRMGRRPERYDRLFGDVPADRPVMTLDVSPAYAKLPRTPRVARRIASLSRPVHLFYLLREPVARAVSHVAHSIGRGRLEAGRLSDIDLQRYVEGSSYSRHLRAYEKAGLGDRITLLDFETLCREPAAVVDAVCRAAGLPSMAVPAALHSNRGTTPPDATATLDLDALRAALRPVRGRMIRRGFEPARAWPRHPRPAAAAPQLAEAGR